MELALKQRLLGAVVLISIGIIVIPMLLDTTPQEPVAPLATTQVEQLTFTHQSLPEALPSEVQEVFPEQDPLTASSDERREKWFVQVGLFADQGNAKKLQVRMKEAGYRSELVAQERDGKQMQLVWVGPYYSQSEAEHVLQGIKKKAALTDAHKGWVVKQL